MDKQQDSFPDICGKESVLVRMKVKNLSMDSFTILGNTLTNRKFVRTQDLAVPQQWRWTWLLEQTVLEDSSHRYGDAFVKIDKPGFAVCTWCVAAINYSHRGKAALADHVKSKKHMDELAMRTDITGHISNNKGLPALEDRVVEMEAMIRSVIAEHNLPASLGSVFVNLARQCCRDPEALASVNLDDPHHPYSVKITSRNKCPESALALLYSCPLFLHIVESHHSTLSICLDDPKHHNEKLDGENQKEAINGKTKQNVISMINSKQSVISLTSKDDEKGEELLSLVNEKKSKKCSSGVVDDKCAATVLNVTEKDLYEGVTNGNKKYIKHYQMGLEKTDGSYLSNSGDSDWCFNVLVSCVDNNKTKQLYVFSLAEVRLRTIDSKIMYEALYEVLSLHDLPWCSLTYLDWVSDSFTKSQRQDLIREINQNVYSFLKDSSNLTNSFLIRLEKEQLSDFGYFSKTFYDKKAEVPIKTVSFQKRKAGSSQCSIELTQIPLKDVFDEPPSKKNIIQISGNDLYNEQSMNYTVAAFFAEEHSTTMAKDCEVAAPGSEQNEHIASEILLSLNGAQHLNNSTLIQTLNKSPTSSLARPTNYNNITYEYQENHPRCTQSSLMSVETSSQQQPFAQDILVNLASIAQAENDSALGVHTAAQGLQALSKRYQAGCIDT